MNSLIGNVNDEMCFAIVIEYIIIFLLSFKAMSGSAIIIIAIIDIICHQILVIQLPRFSFSKFVKILLRSEGDYVTLELSMVGCVIWNLPFIANIIIKANY